MSGACQQHCSPCQFSHPSHWHPPRVQARKQFPQLMEFAQRLECGGELGAETVSTFMHQVLRRRTAASYDNIIARSGMDDEEEVRPAVRACSAVACARQVVQSAEVRLA